MLGVRYSELPSEVKLSEVASVTITLAHQDGARFATENLQQWPTSTVRVRVGKVIHYVRPTPEGVVNLTELDVGTHELSALVTGFLPSPVESVTLESGRTARVALNIGPRQPILRVRVVDESGIGFAGAQVETRRNDLPFKFKTDQPEHESSTNSIGSQARSR